MENPMTWGPIQLAIADSYDVTLIPPDYNFTKMYLNLLEKNLLVKEISLEDFVQFATEVLVQQRRDLEEGLCGSSYESNLMNELIMKHWIL